MPTGSCFCEKIEYEYTGEPAMKVWDKALSSSAQALFYITSKVAHQAGFQFLTQSLGNQALCHCYDCKKISGGHYSHNIVVPLEGFKVTRGTPKTYSKVADSGKEITNHFCGESVPSPPGAIIGPG